MAAPHEGSVVDPTSLIDIDEGVRRALTIEPTPWKSDEINELAAALAKAQGEIEAAERSSDNPFFNSRYADLASVWRAIRGPLTTHGLSVVQLTGPDPAVAHVTTLLLHSSGQWIRSEIAIRPVKADPQGMGSALTYARRYGLSAVAGVAPDDDDGNAASGQRESTKPVTRDSLQREAPPRAANGGTITEKQVNRLWAVAKAAGREKGDIVEYLKSLGYRSSSEIPKSRYDEIIAWVELEGEEGIV